MARLNIAWTKPWVGIAARGLKTLFEVTFSDCRGGPARSLRLTYYYSWRLDAAGYENERGFAAKKLRPYEAAWLK